MNRPRLSRLARTIDAALRDPSPAPWLMLVLVCAPVLLAAWAILSPPILLSNAMTWDLLFNLAGAWHVYLGDTPNINFHEPVGPLNFILTAIGFSLVGPGPVAFLVGLSLVLVTLFVSALLASLRRLPMVPGGLFVIFVCLLVLMPVNIGERIDHYTMAMSYNRYCWAAFSILGLILYVPPRSGRGNDGVDIAITGLLLLAMFYLRITYFIAGLGLVAFALLLQPHVSRRRLAWIILCGLLILNAAAPYSRAYMNDLLAAAANGSVRGDPLMHFKNFLAGAGEYAPYIAAFAIGCWMWLNDRAPARLVISLLVLFALALFLLSQNTQATGLPSAVVIILVIYDQLRHQYAGVRGRVVAPLLAALLVFPAFAVATSAVTIAGYHAKAMRSQSLFVVGTTNLRGLAVPAGEHGAFLNFARSRTDQPLPNEAGQPVPRYELAQFEYVLTIMEALDLLATLKPGGIALFDQVNPLPFGLGIHPVSGANLWSHWGSPMRSPQEYLGDVAYVLVPKFPTDANWTAELSRYYGPYLTEHFRRGPNSPHWILYVRNNAPTILPPYSSSASAAHGAKTLTHEGPAGDISKEGKGP